MTGPAPLSPRAGLALLSLQLRTTMQEAKEAEARADAVDIDAALWQLRARLTPLLDERRRALDEEVTLERERGAEQIAAAHVEAERIIADAIEAAAARVAPVDAAADEDVDEDLDEDDVENDDVVENDVEDDVEPSLPVAAPIAATLAADELADLWAPDAPLPDDLEPTGPELDWIEPELAESPEPTDLDWSVPELTESELIELEMIESELIGSELTESEPIELEPIELESLELDVTDPEPTEHAQALLPPPVIMALPGAEPIADPDATGDTLQWAPSNPAAEQPAGEQPATHVVLDAETFARAFAAAIAPILESQQGTRNQMPPAGWTPAPAPRKSSFWAHAWHPDVLLSGLAMVIVVIVLLAWTG